jgi:cell division protein ZipA
MDARELVILLVGLAIVAVLLRGLYVALQARRGQIRLAIDKNIPQDVDLEALEMTELPSGGARVVARTLEEVNIQNRSHEAFEVVGDDEDELVPILMDRVEPSNMNEASSENAESENHFGNRHEPDGQEEAEWEENSDDELMEYENTEGPNYVAEPASNPVNKQEPDRHEETEREEYRDNKYSDRPEQVSAEAAESSEYDDLDDEVPVQSESDDGEYDHPVESNFLDEEYEVDVDLNEYDRQEPSFGQNFENDLEEFSMTAGERIGELATSEDQGELNGMPENVYSTEVEKPKRRSPLFTMCPRSKDPKPANLGEETSVKDTTVVNFEPEAHPQDVSAETKLSDSSGGVVDPIQPAEIVVINVMARDGYTFSGDDLLQVLINAGLKFGEMNIFHSRLGNDSKSLLVFSVANILNPGTFDLNNLDSFSTLGISLFLALPTAINNMDAFEQMLAVAQQVGSTLDGELTDDHRNVMTAQTIEHYRQRISDFELRQLKAASGHG